MPYIFVSSVEFLKMYLWKYHVVTFTMINYYFVYFILEIYIWNILRNILYIYRFNRTSRDVSPEISYSYIFVSQRH